MALIGTSFSCRQHHGYISQNKLSNRSSCASDFLERLQGKEDYPASLEEHLDWLRRAGLPATCLPLHLRHALIAGKK
ncbi:hypothetical protein [Ktedonobacter robiniae]|uniref:Uncharacterized protein n=1 Tax=Ktedonobacter robiniae TaxID=2778365 RepID=A0ABQ3UWA6_9CHLR|nr:hypothetical protein [Ktedonobacter robiniae]GHO56867.1 hypothetical protein KSB_53420 [Ktedonobacter robiniae]